MGLFAKRKKKWIFQCSLYCDAYQIAKDKSSRKIYEISFGVKLAIDDYEFMGIS